MNCLKVPIKFGPKNIAMGPTAYSLKASAMHHFLTAKTSSNANRNTGTPYPGDCKLSSE